MKKGILLLFAVLSIPITTYCQEDYVAPEPEIISPLLVNGKLFIDSFYKVKSELLIYTEVIQVDSLKKAELIKKVKNWASTNFVNLKEVLVSETDDQIVLNYITKSYFSKTLGIKSFISWYIRLVIEFKDGRFKMSYYDDGNTFIPGSQYAPTVGSRSYHFKDYFKDYHETKVAYKPNTSGLIALHDGIINTSLSVKSYIQKQESKKSDW